MREIIFRGKRLDNGEWVFGMLGQYHDGIKATIMDNHFGVFENTVELVCVAPETVGQYTGLKDKNGKRIFEGDILLLDDIKGLVNYGTGCFCVELPGPDYLYRNNPAIDMVLNEYPGLEIIGNAHDNPELLKEEAQT